MIKLRPHHIEALGIYKSFSRVALPMQVLVQIVLYNPRTFFKQMAFFNKITPDMDIQIVDSLDDLCEMCPHIESCSRENYDSFMEMTMAKRRLFSHFSKYDKRDNPESRDRNSALLYNVEIGKTYKAGMLADQYKLLHGMMTREDFLQKYYPEACMDKD